MSKMEMQSIEIPSSPVVTQQHLDYADGAIRIMRKVGLNPKKALANEMAIACFREWGKGNSTQAEYEHQLKILLILNPSLGI